MSHRFLLRLFAAATPTGDRVTDRDLLRRFSSSRDSAAFELLVHRHADAVWVAGLRILGNEADAEDVFQATFLALMKMGGSVRSECIGGWLQRVAVNAALKARASGGRRPTVPTSQEEPAHAGRSPVERLERDELASIIHQELARLPERYRLPVVLCDLEGQTHAEAARALGWPIGSVSGRLSRAHVILRDRLTRRGLAAPAVLFAATIAPTRTISAATALAAGTVVASPAVSSLTEGVLTAMRIAKLKLAAAVVAASGILAVAGVGSVYVFAQPPAPPIPGEPPVPEKADPIKVVGTGTDITAFPDLTRAVQKLAWDDPKRCPLVFGPDDVATGANDTPYMKLLKARVNLLRQALRLEVTQFQSGRSDGAAIADLTDRLIKAALELEVDPKKKIPWLRERVIVLHNLEALADSRYRAARGTFSAVLMAREQRLAAETDLLLFTSAAAKPKGGR